MDILPAHSDTSTLKSILNSETPLTIIEDLNVTGVNLVLRPVYPLIPELERKWPVTMSMDQIPYVLTRGMYNTVTVMGSLFLSMGFFVTAVLLSNIFTLSVINSRSMTPSIQPKDIILVEKLSAPLLRALNLPVAANGDVIFFSSPPAFNEYLRLNNQRYFDGQQQAQSSSTTDTSKGASTIDTSKLRYLPPVRDTSLIVKRVYSTD
jgi:signal peptidase I